ncbi:hypothetical protein RN04_07830 [Arthrobacter sp. W1]|nr:hypothetical protein RN04_07830 [Arthrobacter sp. W1]
MADEGTAGKLRALRLERARLVVQSGMDYAGVASGLVAGQGCFLFQYRDVMPRGGGQDAGYGNPEDPAANDPDTCFHGSPR